LIELLRRASLRDASHPAIVDDHRTTSYGELVAAAESAAAYLAGHDVRRFGVLDYDAATVVSLLAAASLVGAEACLYPPIEDPEALAEQAARFDHQLVFTHHQDVVGRVPCLDPAELFATPAGEAADPPAARPLLVLTTGTTGTPRGIRHDWNRLLRAAGRIEAAPEQRWLFCYGPHQFGGLQILIHVMASGATLVAPAPRRPREGLAAMGTHRITHVSATPTYWRFLLAEMRSAGNPVPDLQQVTLGGEAVPGPLLGELASTFPNANISQVYAASEFGSSGSVRDARDGLPLSVLDRGDDADIVMKIVDDELWVRSRVGMLGYYGEEADDPDGWRPTGDLVDIDGDRILFRGRSSDIINVGGVKVHPLPVENLISEVPGVKMARVYGRPNAMTGAIVAVEVVAEDGVDTDELDTAIRDACADLVSASRPRSIKFVEEIATTGDKIVRRMNA
jgi:acyl-CoA synthetase (AMP-forming)/AMP-acid ligase II